MFNNNFFFDSVSNLKKKIIIENNQYFFNITNYFYSNLIKQINYSNYSKKYSDLGLLINKIFLKKKKKKFQFRILKTKFYNKVMISRNIL